MSIGISSGPESSGSPIKDVATGQTQTNVLIEKPIMARVLFSEALPQLPPKLAQQLQAVMPGLSAPLYRVQLDIGQQKLITYSQTPLPAGEIVQVSPRADGQLQASALPRSELSLNLATLNKPLLNMPVLDTGNMPRLPPTSVLNPAQIISPEIVKQAIAQSGQFFERHLLNHGTTGNNISHTVLPNAAKGQALANNPLNQGNVLPTTPPAQNTQNPAQTTRTVEPDNPLSAGQSKTAPTLDLNNNWQKLQQNVKNMGLWLDKALGGKTDKIPAPVALTATRSQAPATHNMPGNIQGQSSLGTLVSQAGPGTGPGQTATLNNQPLSTNQALQQDFKAWLIVNQQQLKEQLNQHLLLKGQSTKPWLPERFATTDSVTNNQPHNIWPRNLSWQPILLNHLQENDPHMDQKQDALVKLLLQVSQGLGRIQQDQAGNRQQQGVNPQTDINLQLPYLEQQQIRFVEIELQEKNTKVENTKQQVRAWHMILRFEQASPFPFAIELSLHSMQVNLHCWAQHTLFVAALREKLPLLRKKLTAAGFNCQQLDTKLGSPAPLKRQIQQYRVDIHT